MGESFITRRGGGGLSLFAAVIHVNAPVGSTVTFKKGDLIVKEMGPEKSHPNSDGLYADYYHSASTYNYGEWTITASLEAMSISKTIEVKEAEQYDVTLRYELVLFKEGTGLMNGYVFDKKIGSVVEATSAKIHCESATSSWFWFTLKPTIPDIVKYGKLQVTAQSDMQDGTILVGLTTGATGSSPTWAASKSITKDNTRHVTELDISQIASGDYYFQTQRNNGPSYTDFFDIRLLPRNEEA